MFPGLSPLRRGRLLSKCARTPASRGFLSKGVPMTEASDWNSCHGGVWEGQGSSPVKREHFAGLPHSRPAVLPTQPFPCPLQPRSRSNPAVQERSPRLCSVAAPPKATAFWASLEQPRRNGQQFGTPGFAIAHLSGTTVPPRLGLNEQGTS